jgi:uncharacterized membrane protein
VLSLSGNIPYQSQKVAIVNVDYPKKVFNLQPFTINVDLHAFQGGGQIRVALKLGTSNYTSTTSNILLNPFGSDTSVSLNLELPWAVRPYNFTVIAYWDASLGGETQEDTRNISIQSVIISLEILGTSQPAKSNSRFNVTYTITNNGTDVAHEVTVQMTGQGGFGLLQNGTISLGDIAPGESKTINFTLVSSVYDLIPGERQLTLTATHYDWEGASHSQTANMAVYLQVSETTVRFWTIPGLAIFAMIIGVVLLILRKIKRVQVGPVSLQR